MNIVVDFIFIVVHVDVSNSFGAGVSNGNSVSITMYFFRIVWLALCSNRWRLCDISIHTFSRLFRIHYRLQSQLTHTVKYMTIIASDRHQWDLNFFCSLSISLFRMGNFVATVPSLRVMESRVLCLFRHWIGSVCLFLWEKSNKIKTTPHLTIAKIIIRMQWKLNNNT